MDKRDGVRQVLTDVSTSRVHLYTWRSECSFSLGACTNTNSTSNYESYFASSATFLISRGGGWKGISLEMLFPTAVKRETEITFQAILYDI